MHDLVVITIGIDPVIHLVIALFAIGRFGEFFLRSDSPELALGLSNAQWTSVALLVAAVVGRTFAARRSSRRGFPALPHRR
jgi:prolipoprotein diacylglyceryltransferase